jgi:hypothetical protein
MTRGAYRDRAARICRRLTTSRKAILVAQLERETDVEPWPEDYCSLTM